MDLLNTLPAIVKAFDGAELRYALIGGLAMAFHGLQRATFDVDFILLAEDLDSCDSILKGFGFSRTFHTENVSQFVAASPSPMRIDILHAFRPATLGMLKRSERLPLAEDTRIPVVGIEDIVGLKLQAACNDPERHEGDWSDIRRLIDHAGRSGKSLDWELICDYLALFDIPDLLNELKRIHDKA